MRCRIFDGVAALLSSSRRFVEKVVVVAAAFSLGSSWASGETVGFEGAEGYAPGVIVFDAADVGSQGSLRSEVVYESADRGQVVELTVGAEGGALSVDVLSSESGDRLGSLMALATGAGYERVTVGGIAIDFAGAPDSWRELALGRRSESGYPVTLDGSIVGYLGALAGVQVVFHPVQGTLSIDELTWIDTEEGEPAPTHGLLREVWLGIRGNHLSKLRESGTFPGTPSIVDVVPDFEAPSNWANNYGTRLRGYLTAPQDGVYEFWISGDDRSELYLSPDSSPLNAVQIAQVPGWTGIREWEKYADDQVSVGVTLAAGEPVYIEALQKECGGRDNLAVAWRGPGIPERTVITGSYLTPWEAASPSLASPSICQIVSSS